MKKIFNNITSQKAIEHLMILKNVLKIALEYNLKESNFKMTKIKQYMKSLTYNLEMANDIFTQLISDLSKYIDFDLTDIQKRVLNYLYLKKEGEAILEGELFSVFKIRKGDYDKVIKPLILKDYIKELIVTEKINNEWKDLKYLNITKKTTILIDNEDL